MSSTLIDIAACLARLVAQNPAGFFNTLDTAYDMNPIEDDSELPACFIYPGYVDADPIGDGSTHQKLHHTLILDVLCDVADIQDAVGHLRSIFIGWEMDQYHGPFVLAFPGHMQGQACGPIDLRGGVIHWQERYQNSTHTRRVHN